MYSYSSAFCVEACPPSLAGAPAPFASFPALPGLLEPGLPDGDPVFHPGREPSESEAVFTSASRELSGSAAFFAISRLNFSIPEITVFFSSLPVCLIELTYGSVSLPIIANFLRLASFIVFNFS